jgi:uncharacterized circularly permuted ATP-grasp superfamily protein
LYVNQGCQIFLGITYQNGEKLAKDHKIYQMAIKYVYQMVVKYSNCPQKIPTFLFQGPPKFTQTRIFGYEMCIPTGNPDAY